MRPSLVLSVSACLLLALGCRKSPQVAPTPAPATTASTARPLARATPEALEFEFGRPQATGCGCFKSASADAGTTPPRFSVYLLALTWAPNFCLGHADKEECHQLKGSFAATHLTLHGLWPQFSDAESREHGCTYPAFCGGFCACQGQGAPEQCFPDPAVIPAKMADYGPGYVTDNYFLANHEWPKHGSCTGLDAGTYFSKAIEALLSLPGDQGTPELISGNIGGRVALSDLRTAFGPSANVVLSCDPRCNLMEVGVCFGVDGQGNPTAQMSCPQNVTSGNSNSCVGNPSSPRCPTVSIQAAKNADDTGTGGGNCGHPGQGPACSNDSTCQQQGYVRCARSGCCTTVPKP
ncbi:hypothetical protein P2318_24915 [Myxococcaceae bacterium GXIMD 01537]